jgi:hypothetical protein
MRAGRPHGDVSQFIASGSRFGQRRIGDEDGARYVVVPAELPDGGRLELWVAPELVPLLAAALAGRPAAPVERLCVRPGDAAAWRMVDGSPGDLYDPTDAESAGGGLS